MKKKKQTVIPKFSSEAEEAAWWNAHRSEIEAEVRASVRKPNVAKRRQLATLADRVVAEINERASKMTLRERTKADSETKRIAAQVKRGRPQKP